MVLLITINTYYLRVVGASTQYFNRLSLIDLTKSLYSFVLFLRNWGTSRVSYIEIFFAPEKMDIFNTNLTVTSLYLHYEEGGY